MIDWAVGKSNGLAALFALGWEAGKNFLTFCPALASYMQVSLMKGSKNFLVEAGYKRFSDEFIDIDHIIYVVGQLL